MNPHRLDVALRLVILWGMSIGLAIWTGTESSAGEKSGDAPLRRTLHLPDSPHQYAITSWSDYLESAHVPIFDTTSSDNPLTDAGATLGRVLFYDVQLSANHTINCASCHQPEFSFSDPRPVSVGFQGRSTDRNSMALNDLRFVRAGFFWDERSASLEEAVLLPLFSHIEMGLNRELLVQRLTADPHYPPLFAAAFGDEQVTEARVAKALAQFLRAMTTFQSKYDKAAAVVETAKDDFPDFTASENLGKSLFFKHCASCHHLGEGKHVAIFAMFRSLNNGIDTDGRARDGGRGDVTFDPGDVGLFKASSLRNIELTAPYMHDGRLATLEDVIEHYSVGVQRHPTLGPVSRFHFSPEEKTGLVDFLKTLTDRSLTSDPRFSDPWRSTGNPAAVPVTTASLPQNVSPRTSPSETPAERLAAGRGLTEAETLVWLRSLDADQSGDLDEAEMEAVVRIVAANGMVERLSVLRRPRRVRDRDATAQRGTEPASSPAAETKSDSLVGDFNRDGVADEAEERRYQALKRFLESHDGGRFEVLLDRVLGRFDFTPAQIAEVRVPIRDAKLALNRQRHAETVQLSQALRQRIGSEAYLRFSELIIDAQVLGSSRPAVQEEEEQAREIAWQTDTNGDRRIDEQELLRLARELARQPGGFGQAASAGIDVSEFSRRIMAFDEDGDGCVSPEELPERMSDFARHGDADGDGRLSFEESRNHFRRVSYERLLTTGIYIGGAFADTIPFYADRLNQLDLSPEAHEDAQRLIEESRQRLLQAAEKTLDEEFQRLQRLHASKAESPTAAGH